MTRENNPTPFVRVEACALQKTGAQICSDYHHIIEIGVPRPRTDDRLGKSLTRAHRANKGYGFVKRDRRRLPSRTQ